MPKQTVNTKLDTLIQTVSQISTTQAVMSNELVHIKCSTDKMEKSLETQNSRISSLERWKAKMVGIATAAATGASTAAHFIIESFKRGG